MIAAAVLVATSTLPGVAADPRPELVERDLARREVSALSLANQAIRRDPVAAEELGLDFFRGHLLQQLGRTRDATAAFAQALATPSPLDAWARTHLAEIQERLGHPEVAAGLIAGMLAHRPSDSLTRRGLELLARSIQAGGDCRLLAALPRGRFSGSERRIRDLMDLSCERQQDGGRSVPAGLRSFLQSSTSDAEAWEAAEPLLDHGPTGDRNLDLLLALTAFHHRDFERAARLFDRLGNLVPASPVDTLTAQAAYARARTAFWLGSYREAALRFEALARSSYDDSARANADHQLGRSLELVGNTEGARAAFERAYLEDPRGDWAGASLLSDLRLALLSGDESGARNRLSTMAGNPALASVTARGALFIAVSQLVRGRSDGVAALLSLANRTRQASDEEIAYWRGRLAELEGSIDHAVSFYLAATEERPFHPFALAARARLRRPTLTPALKKRMRALATASDPQSLWRASLLSLGAEDRAEFERRGRAALGKRPDAAEWVAGGFLPIDEWPVWKGEESDRPEDLLARLGLVAEAPESIWRYFPASDPRTALTGAVLLARGEANRRSIEVAEVVFRRRPRSVPLRWVAPEWLRLLYPAPWREAIIGQSVARAIDPSLLAAVLREESRFDPDAISPAAARGLSQLVLPTAQRLAAQAGLQPPHARDLHDPLLSILLGATYLAELSDRFQGNPIAMAAAYNAGEDQAAAWIRSSFTNEPEELLSKIGFGETRAYVFRVLQSQATYSYLGLSAAP